MLAVFGPVEGFDVGFVTGELPGFAAFRRDQPDLVGGGFAGLGVSVGLRVFLFVFFFGWGHFPFFFFRVFFFRVLLGVFVGRRFPASRFREDGKR